MVRVVLARLFGVMLRLHVMPLRHVRVMPGLVMVAGVVMVRSRFVMLSGALVMLCGFPMMIRCFL